MTLTDESRGVLLGKVKMFGTSMEADNAPQHDGVKTTNKKSHTQNSFKIHF